MARPHVSDRPRPFGGGLTVAIVGRPNVGKSTLFNRLAGKRLAIVDDTPGVTRDWRAAPAELAGMQFTVLDTAGLEEAEVESLEGRMRQATEQALDLADVALFLVDARQGIMPLDHHFADLLRRRQTPVILVANKVEGAMVEAAAYEAYALGLGDPVMLSAEHGQGLAELVDALSPFYDRHGAPAADDDQDPFDPGEDMPAAAVTEPDFSEDETLPDAPPEDPTRPIQLAIVGRPNAGKSTLLNTLIGAERSIVGPEAGLTRDAVSVDFEWAGRPFRLVDTAGLRRRARIHEKLEHLSVAATLRVIRLAQAVILVIDGQSILDKQDLAIARHVVDEGRILVIAVNKWDLVTDKTEALQRLKDRLSISLPQIRGVPTVTLSALTGLRATNALDQVLKIYPVWNQRIATGPLNRWLRARTQAHPPPLVRGRPNRIRYISQINTRPPTFALWCGHPQELPETYLRYLVNALRDDFGFDGVPVRLLTRGHDNPYASEGRR